MFVSAEERASAAVQKWLCRFIASSCLVSASSGLVAAPASLEKSPQAIVLERIGGFNGGASGAAEISAYDVASKRLFVVNGANGSVDVLDLSEPKNPALIGQIVVSSFGGSVNSVAVHGGLVALAVESRPKTNSGVVAFYNAADLQALHRVTVGSQPDMVTFTPDGKYVLTANEGEPNSYGKPDSIDPEGSVSIITVNRGGVPSVATADFKPWIGREADLRAQGVRIYGPQANAAQDLEPEYIAISPDGKRAFVTLQENNALAIVDIAAAKVTAIKALGSKNHQLAGAGLDASDKDGGQDSNSGTPAVKIVPQPVLGLYMPDGIASYQVGGQTYLVTANEGDARADWPGFNEETRVRAYCDKGLDPAVFGVAADRLLLDSNLGRLRITNTPNGGATGKNDRGQCTALYAFGGRSFSIWTADGVRVFDSGDDLEQRTTALAQVKFNAGHDNDTMDSRSPAKGPEPEGVVLGRLGEKTYAFIGLERVGGVMVYDVSDPARPVFSSYVNTREGVTGDRGAEGLLLIEAQNAPGGKPLLVVSNEVSGTTAIYQINPGH